MAALIRFGTCGRLTINAVIDHAACFDRRIDRPNAILANTEVMERQFNWSWALQRAPAAAGDEAYRRFCLPLLSPHRSPDYQQLVARARHHLQAAHWIEAPSPVGSIQAYGFEPPPDTPQQSSILLVHGWTSEAAFMSAFIQPLRSHGHRLILLDLPAHGRSAGTRATIIDCARAILAVADQLGPFDVVIAHSIGGLASLLAAEGAPPLSHGANFARYVLLASPNRFTDVTKSYGAHLGLNPAAQRVFERRLARVGHRRLDSLQARGILEKLTASALVVHSKDDAQVAFSNAEEICAGLPRAQLASYAQLGHAKILFAPPAIRQVREFCAA